jgi:hypothetical protein
MTYHAISTLGAITLATTLVAQAQTRSPAPSPAAPVPQTPAQTAQRPDPEVDVDMKVVGCLRLWDASIAALTGQASTGPRYVLINARQENNPGRDVVVLRRYVVVGDPSVNLAGHIDHTVRISGSVAPLLPLKLPAPGEAPLKPGVPGRTADTAVRPGEAARPGEIPAPVSEKPDPDPNWLSLKASSVTMLSGSCSPL